MDVHQRWAIPDSIFHRTTADQSMEQNTGPPTTHNQWLTIIVHQPKLILVIIQQYHVSVTYLIYL